MNTAEIIPKTKDISPSTLTEPVSPTTRLKWLDHSIETVLILAITITPLIFSPLSRELFEFPKMVWVYALAIVALGLILFKSFSLKEIALPLHPLKFPLIIFGLILVISTILSINPYTSVMGYYSRFHGGLASFAAYITLFYLALIYLQPSGTRTLRISKLAWSWVASSIIIGIWGIAEHFGMSPSCWLLRGELDASCWVQDVQARVFATFGQPNWLAAYLITSIPLSLALLISTTRAQLRIIAWLGVVIGYAALWYTYSRSGWIGLAIAILVLLPWAWRINYRKLWPWLTAAVLVCGLISLSSIQMASKRTATALETGSLDSSTGQIRLLVWQGSLETIVEYPIFGSGLETFPYSFLHHRPAALNQTTEWSFLYNKAHNDILQAATTTGIIGLFAWLLLYGKLALTAWKQRYIALRPQLLSGDGIIPASLFAGIVGVFAAQLLGFSVVVTGLYFWLAAAVIIAPLSTAKHISIKPHANLIVGIVGVFLTAFLTIGLSCYFFAEVIANAASSTLRSNPWRTEQQLQVATQLNPYEPSYQHQLALASAYIAQVSTTDELVAHYAKQADKQAQHAYKLNPHHILNLKAITTVYQQLSTVDQKYLSMALKFAQKTVSLDENDANAQQTLAQLYLQDRQYALALNSLNSLIALRPQSANSFIQRARYYQQTNQPDLAEQDIALALTLEPNNQEALDARRHIKEEQQLD